MEELFQERIFENLTNEEKSIIIKNMKLAEKIYIIGLMDCANIDKKIITFLSH